MRCPNCRKIVKDGVVRIVPCGKCEVCIDNRRRDYAVRLNFAMQKYKACFFLTLTFEDSYLPASREECVRFHKLFMKRLRKQDRFGTELKYFSVLEKGELNGRFHWHCLLFMNEVFSKETVLDYVYHAWRDPKTKQYIGFVQCGYGQPGSASYLTKYLFKQDYKMLISRGLGFPDLEDNSIVDRFVKGSVHFNGFQYAFGNSIKSKFNRDNPEKYKFIKNVLKPQFEIKNNIDYEKETIEYYLDIEKRKKDYEYYITKKHSEENKY